MQNFQGIIFIQIKINREIFKSALVYLWMVYQVIDNVKVFRAYQNQSFMCWFGRNPQLWWIKKVANPKLDNFAILVWAINLLKYQEFIGQLAENNL